MSKSSIVKNFVSAIKNIVSADTVNAAGGKAYSRTAQEALAQLAVTGTKGGTYYASGSVVESEILTLANQCSPEFLAKLAVYSRESAFMKDSPALLLAVLMTKDMDLFAKIFPRVIDNGKMLRNFCKVVRSGAVGRKSFGSRPRALIRQWIENRSAERLFDDAVGNDPSMADIIKMVHVKPSSNERAALYGYLIGKDIQDKTHLPEIVKNYEEFRSGKTRALPRVSFQRLTDLALSVEDWTELALNGGWHMIRMNLNTFERHDVFKNPEVVGKIAEKLANTEAIRRSKVFPYQLYIAEKMATTAPQPIKEALTAAMEESTKNIPYFDGKVYVAVDFSGSMTAPVTGANGKPSVVRCNEVASLFAACVVRNSNNAEVYRFDTNNYPVQLDPNDSVFVNTRKIAANGGGTDCSVTLADLNKKNAIGDLVFILSDTESWSNSYDNGGQRTRMAAEWVKFKARNPKAKLVCVDLAANSTTQAPTTKDVLNVGGWSDAAFVAIDAFIKGTEGSWVGMIENVIL